MGSGILEHQEAQLDKALSIAIQAGVIASCPFHEGCTYDGGVEIEAAYKLGNYLYSQGELVDLFEDRREMTDTILAVVKEHGINDECVRCADIRDKD